ncbi:hypothetical protein ACMXYQ_10675 [Neptuniibacter sp. PT34_22]|uniref:hypothetical protein n=1 Tax=Neptuniibacter sp. PT34_22 TaxID=3398205 RepID=UPI0039F52003
MELDFNLHIYNNGRSEELLSLFTKNEVVEDQDSFVNVSKKLNSVNGEKLASELLAKHQFSELQTQNFRYGDEDKALLYFFGGSLHEPIFIDIIKFIAQISDDFRCEGSIAYDGMFEHIHTVKDGGITSRNNKLSYCEEGGDEDEDDNIFYELPENLIDLDVEQLSTDLFDFYNENLGGEIQSIDIKVSYDLEGFHIFNVELVWYGETEKVDLSEFGTPSNLKLGVYLCLTKQTGYCTHDVTFEKGTPFNFSFASSGNNFKNEEQKTEFLNSLFKKRI